MNRKNLLHEKIAEYLKTKGVSVKTIVIADLTFIDLIKFFKLNGVSSMQYIFISLIKNNRSMADYYALGRGKKIAYHIYRNVVNTLSYFYPQAS